MIGVVTTVAAIALAHAVAKPASKEDGWYLDDAATIRLADDVTPTDKPILIPTAFGTWARSPHYARSNEVLGRIEWAQSELQNYKSLPDGWDGEGSVAADAAHIDAASRLLQLLPAGIPLPKPMMSADGEVGLYWHTDAYVADAVIEDGDHFSLFIRSLMDGHKEVYLPTIEIARAASGAISGAFQTI